VLRNQKVFTGEKEKSDANDDCDQLHDSSGENFLRQPDTVLSTAFWKTRSLNFLDI
jgi:hypothetical protein